MRRQKSTDERKQPGLQTKAPQADMTVLLRAGGAIGGEKITSRHLERLSMVYVRQSTPQQMIRHQESTQVQYQLKYRAQQLGWPEDRIEIIDEDLGQTATSTEGRHGFQRLMAEVSLDHVGIIFGIEMSRLARSCKDWHQMLEVCALFGTLIADLDGIYDPSHYNDRLLLGLKGTISEAELHILKQRMYQGKMNKARRGELLFNLPIGYVRRPNDEVGFDPDEQVQEVVRLVFRKYEELGTVNAVLQYLSHHNIQSGIRMNTGPAKGEIKWRRFSRTVLLKMLKNPMYAGAYVYGKRKVDPRRKIAGRPHSGRRVVAPQDCDVFLKDRFPAYISWEQFERHQEQMKRNRSVSDSMGSIRHGAALLTGLLVCKKCGFRMGVRYDASGKRHQYFCDKMRANYGAENCQSLSGPPLDSFISEQLLDILKPTSLSLSLESAENTEKERQELDILWQKRLERARYESERAARQYSLVEPENRLVARQLEKEWEEKLKEQQKLEMDYERFQSHRPRLLCQEEREQISQLAEDIPALWNDQDITAAERKEILRQVIDRIMIDVVDGTERVKVDIHWAGGLVSELETKRPVAKVEQLSYYPDIVKCVTQLAEQGHTTGYIADQLNQEGWLPPKKMEKFDYGSVREIMIRLGLREQCSKNRDMSKLGQDEWLLPQLAGELKMPIPSLYAWVRRGWVKARLHERPKNLWIVWADPQEVERLHQLRRKSLNHHILRHYWFKKAEAEKSKVGMNE